MCVRAACVRACVRAACVRACVRACTDVYKCVNTVVRRCFVLFLVFSKYYIVFRCARQCCMLMAYILTSN